MSLCVFSLSLAYMGLMDRKELIIDYLTGSKAKYP